MQARKREPDPLEIPAFLRVANRAKPRIRVGGKKKERTVAALAGSEPETPPIADPLADFARAHRYAPSALRESSSRRLLEQMMEEQRLRAEERAKTAEEKRAERQAEWEQMVVALDLVEGVPPKFVRNALRRSAIRVVRGRVHPDDAENATLAIQEYVPPRKERKTGGAKRARISRKLDAPPEAVIRVARGRKNPKREGSDAHARWAKVLSSDGKTIAEFLKSGGSATALRNAARRKFVKLAVSP